METKSNDKIKPIIALRGYSRGGSFPLDDTTLFFEYAEARKYVQEKNTTAYPGQLIAVDDKTRRKVKLYQVTYDKAPDAQNRFYLAEFQVGSSSVGFANFKGTLDSYDELLNIPDPKVNDLWFVKNPEGAYNSYIYLKNNDVLEWTNIDLGIGLASKEKSGLMSSELYNALSGIAVPGIFYNAGIRDDHESRPEDGRFIELDTDNNEEHPIIQSANKLKKTLYSTIYSIMDSNPPKIIMKSNYDLTNVYLGQEFLNFKINLYYYPNLGGTIKSCIINHTYEKSNDSDEKTLINIPVDKFVYNEELRRWECLEINIGNVKITSENELENVIGVKILYNENHETMYPEGDCVSFIDINVRKRFQVRYGHYDEINGNEEHIVYDKLFTDQPVIFVKEASKFLVEMDPGDNGIYTFQFRSPYLIKSILYMQQQDHKFLDTLGAPVLEKIKNPFKESEELTYWLYTFKGYKDYPMMVHLDFIIET